MLAATPYEGQIVTMSQSIIKLSNRSLLKITGEDARGFLNRILTCRVDDLEPGGATFGALLTPQGKIICDLFLYNNDDALFLDLPVPVSGDIQKRLTMLKLRADVQIEACEEMSVALSEDAEKADACHAHFHDPRRDGLLLRLLLNEQKPELTVPSDKYHQYRAENTLPECCLDYETSSVFPADVNMDLMGGVDYKKGCFVGQEVVSRMKRKAEVRKRTVTLTGAASAVAGDEVKAGTAKIGDVLSWSGNSGLVILRLDRLKSAQERDEIPELNGAVVEISFPPGVEAPANV